ncbi:dihydrodipicolinate synthase family protein [Streptomyces mashuensis]|uniref:Dihydrodipicolinate synthase family protein n=1 Tax=Streptomyces mashuensis TaxID=33904 RepID=A0A919B653_9ACTN|nr:dihydrodipicolinate synthase family protein [Streptomyces mashuensis]GHF60480.1 dihydrodipicolinate synthase family protein [Streptomyces mashuensis]
MRLSGVIPPVCTPFTEDGEVDTRSLAALVEHVLAGGASAVFVLGTCGEAAYLTDAQRRTVVRTAVEAVAGRVPVLAGAIDMTTARVLEHARAAAGLGADALVVTAPFYASAGPAEIAGHFRRVRDGGGLPLVAYDIPAAVHVKLAPETVLELAADGTIAGLKDSSGDLDGLRRLLVALKDRAADGEGLSVLTGSELSVDGALLAGADGVVPGLSNVDPAGYVRLCVHARAARWAEAAAEQDRLAALQALAMAPAAPAAPSAPAAYKAALHLLGVITCPATAASPRPLPEAGVAAVRELLVRAGLLVRRSSPTA